MVVITTLTGMTFEVKALMSDRVDLVKSRIYDAVGIPVDQFTLLFKSKELEDIKTLSNYNIHKRSLLHLVVRL